MKTIFAAALGVALLGAGLAHADPLPPGPGRNVVINKCSGCHATALIENERHDADGWAETVDKMSDRGLEISDADRATVVAYLTKALGPQAKSAASAKPAVTPTKAKMVAKPAVKAKP